MDGSPPHRKVLIIENEPDVRNALYVLLAGLGCEAEVAPGVRNALARISTERFDAVMLDLRCCGESPEQAVLQIKEICPSLVGRLVVITADVTSPRVLEALERQCLPKVRHRHLTQDLMNVLKSLF